MLKNVPITLTPELYRLLYDMGHGDAIVIADANFPAAASAQRLYHCPNMGACEALALVLGCIPVDTFVDTPVTYMAVAPGDNYKPDIWDDFDRIVARHHGTPVVPRHMPRAEFYAATRDAYAVFLTGERRRYGNILINKGVIETSA